MEYRFTSLVLRKDLFDSKILGFINGIKVFNDDDLKYALIVTYHPSIIARIEAIRKRIPNYPFKYEELASLEDFLRYKNKINESIDSDIESMIQDLIKDLKLNLNWNIPLFIKVCTDVLPIPYSASRFSFVGPNLKVINQESRDKSINSLRDLTRPDVLSSAFSAFERLQDATIYPYIAIKERLTSKKQLTDYISKIYKTQILPATINLPIYKHKGIGMERFILAVWLYDLITNRHLSPKAIQNVIEDVDKDQKKFTGYDITNTGISKLADEARVKFAEVYPL